MQQWRWERKTAGTSTAVGASLVYATLPSDFETKPTVGKKRVYSINDTSPSRTSLSLTKNDKYRQLACIQLENPITVAYGCRDVARILNKPKFKKVTVYHHLTL